MHFTKQQKRMVSVINDIIAGDALITGKLITFLRRRSHVSGCLSSYLFFDKRAKEGLPARWLLAGMRAGSKMDCVVLCDFYFCCAFIFCQPMKKFEFFGASRATRQRHFKPKDEWLWGRE